MSKIHFTRQQQNQPQDAENRTKETQDTRQPEAAAMASANANYSDAREKFEDIFNEAACLSELIDGPIVASELHLSISAAMGLGSILRGFNKRGWQTLELLDEAWSAKAGGGNE